MLRVAYLEKYEMYIPLKFVNPNADVMRVNVMIEAEAHFPSANCRNS